MNKGELVDKIAKDAKITKGQAADALDAVVTAIESTLGKGGKVTLVGFGTFSVAKRAARTGRNPRTGKEIKIAQASGELRSYSLTRYDRTNQNTILDQRPNIPARHLVRAGPGGQRRYGFLL